MNILIDISHPAHVHFFRYAILEWQKHGHQIQVVARDKDLTLHLLSEYEFAFICLSKARRGSVGLLLELLEHELHLALVAHDFQPDVMLNIGGTFIVHIGRLLHIPTIVFSDTEMAKVANRITYPFADTICTPECYQDDLGEKQIRYAGYQELAYMHPHYFTPNFKTLDEIDLEPEEKLFVIRLVSWEAAHDIGKSGFSLNGKRELVRHLSGLGRVIITSESPLPPEFEPYRMRVSPTKIHDLLAFSTLYIGESATMASESAILGTPFIFVSPIGRGYVDEQEKKYGLGYTISPDQERHAIDLAVELAQRDNLREEWQVKRERMLRDKIDVTAWMVDFVERYPENMAW
jgi:uncharacterized protein